MVVCKVFQPAMLVYQRAGVRGYELPACRVQTHGSSASPRSTTWMVRLKSSCWINCRESPDQGWAAGGCGVVWLVTRMLHGTNGIFSTTFTIHLSQMSLKFQPNVVKIYHTKEHMGKMTYAILHPPRMLVLVANEGFSSWDSRTQKMYSTAFVTVILGGWGGVDTLPETNIAFEHWWLGGYFELVTLIFRGVNFEFLGVREGY